jgi:hypothetical protein
MAVNRYYRGTEYRPELYAPPVQFIGAALEQAQKQYDVNFAAAQGLKNKYIQARPQDRARANQLQQEFESRIDSVASKYNGDYSQAGKDLYKLQADMSKLYGPGGEAFAIQQNLALTQDSLKRERERLAKGEITQQQLASLNNYYNRQGPTQLNPETGTYNQVNSVDLAKYYAVDKEFDEYMKGVKPKTIERAYRTGRVINGEIESVTMKKQYIDPNEVAQGFTSKLYSDAGFTNYMRQMADLNGEDVNSAMDGVISNYTNNIIPTRTGILEDSQKLDYKLDWKTKSDYEFKQQWSLAEKRHQDALSRLKFKDQLDNASAGDGQSSYLTVAGDANSNFTPIPETTKVTTGNSRMSLFGWMGTEEKPTSVQELLLNRNNPNYNYGRLESIQKANPNLRDADIIRKYNESVSKDSGVREYARVDYDAYNTTPVQQEEANRLMPGLMQGTYEIYRKDNATGKVVRVVNAEDRIDFAKKLANEKNPLKADYGALGRARGHTGHVPSGSVVLPDPYGKGDYYFVAPNRVDIKNYQDEVLGKAFGFIQRPELEEGEVFPVKNTKNGGMSYAKGKKEYVDGRMHVVYYPVKLGPNGTHLTDYSDPFTVGNGVATTSEMERMLLPWEDVKKLYPHKKKADLENEELTQ